MPLRLLGRCAQLGRALARGLRECLLAATKPADQALVAGTLADLVRCRPALPAENAFLRQQLGVLRRSVERPRRTSSDRALVIVQPETLLRWHRGSFRLFGRRPSRSRSSPKPQVAAETIALIRAIAAANPGR